MPIINKPRVTFIGTLLSIVVSGSILARTVDSNYYLTFLLPLTFAFCFACSVNINKYFGNKIVYTIIIIGFFIRNVLLPLFMSMSEYNIWLGYYNTSISMAEIERAYPIAIYLMCIEQLSVFIYLNRSYKYGENFNYKDTRVRLKKEKTILGEDFLYYLVVFSLLGIVVACIVAYPSLKKYLKFIWTINVNARDLDVKGNASFAVYRIFLWFVDMLQFLIPITLVSWIERSRFTRKVRLFLLLLVIAMTVCITTDNNVLSILYAILLLVYYTKSNNKSVVLMFGIGVIAIITINGLLSKTLLVNINGKREFTILTGMLNAYFNGPYNVAIGVMISDKVNIMTFFGDILNSIPFFPVFFGQMITSPQQFNWIVKGEGTGVTKIIPLISQGSIYFTPIFAPLLTVLVVSIARKYEKRARYYTRIFNRISSSYLSIFCAITPFLYNANILIKNLCNFAIIMCILRLNAKNTREDTYE